MKNNMTKRLLAALMAAAMLLGMAACGKPADGGTAQDGGQQATTALTKDEYKQAFQDMSKSLEDIQTNATNVDMNDPEAAKAVLEEMKGPLNDFIAVTPPEEYKDAHAKLKSGCEAMVGFVDSVLGMVGETDQAKLKTAGEEMQTYLTTAITDITAGAQMLDAME